MAGFLSKNVPAGNLPPAPKGRKVEKKKSMFISIGITIRNFNLQSPEDEFQFPGFLISVELWL